MLTLINIYVKCNKFSMNYQDFKANIKALEALIFTAPHLLSLINKMSKVYIKEKYTLYNTLCELSKVNL